MATKSKALKTQEKEVKLNEAAQAGLDESIRLQQLAFDGRVRFLSLVSVRSS